jgi:hypothetical protein
VHGNDEGRSACKLGLTKADTPDQQKQRLNRPGFCGGCLV